MFENTPSHYDDDGYVIQRHRSAVPPNTLAALYGLTRDVIERTVLGDDVDIVINAYDETNTRVPIRQIIRQIKTRTAVVLSTCNASIITYENPIVLFNG